MSRTVTANYYDGRSARQQAVTLRIEQGLLEMQGEELLRVTPLGEINISPRLGSTPRLLHFADNSHCEINNHAEFDAMLEDAGIKPQSLVSHLESTWHHAVAATLMSITVIIAAFYWGLPWMADFAAARIPPAVTLAIDTHVLGAIDNGLMQPSTIGIARQQTLRQRVENLQEKHDLPPYKLEFRTSMTTGANAYALPGGTIILTDQLVSLAGHDDEIIAVLAHELGHVSERHPLRQLLQSSVVGLAMTWYLGDISTLLAAAPTLLLESSYSRDFERRADNYAAEILRLNGITPARLADILGKLESFHTGAKESKKQSFRISEIFSSHPDTEERIRALRSDTAR